MSYVGRTIRHDSLNKTVIQGCVFGEIRRGRPRKNWMDNIVESAGSEIDLTQLLEAIHGTMTDGIEFVLQRFIYPYDQPVKGLSK